MNKLFFTLAIAALSTSASAQQFNSGNLNPATSKVYQPASMVCNYKVSVNALSVSGAFWNNGYSFTKDFLFSSAVNSAAEGKDFFKNKDNDSKSAAANLDMVGPSVSYNLGKAGYVGFYTRFREVVNFDRLDSKVFKAFNDLDNNVWDHTFSQQNLNVSIHAFSEIGLNYGREIYNTNGHHLSAGATVKVISGISAAYIGVDNLSVNISPDTINKISGNFTVAYSDKAGSLTKAAVTTPSQIMNMSGPKSVGADLGLSYEFRDAHKKSYVLKVNLAVTDIGSVKYATSKNSKTFKVDAANQDIESLGFKSKQSPSQYLAELQKRGIIDSEKPVKSLTVSLPTALRGNVDYHVAARFYINADFLFSVSKGISTYTNNISIMPSYRSKWFAVGLPVSSNKISGANFGAYVKAGPLQVGSATLVSNLMKDRISSVDLYAALSWNF